MSYTVLDVTVGDGVQIIKLNRPEKKNAINTAMYREIPRALRAGAEDDSVVVTVITGAGDYYCSGNDITVYAERDMSNASQVIREAAATLEDFVRRFIDYPKILVALVNGPAIGLATTLLGLCDLVLASERATFFTPFTPLGLSPEGCSSYTFPKIMGSARASQLLYCGRKVSADEAKEFGLVSRVFPHDQLDLAWKDIYDLSKLPSKSLIYSKLLVRSQEKKALYEANRAECERLTERWTSEESLDAIMKFLSRRSKM